MAVSERSTAALELTFKDEDGTLISVATMTAYLFEVHAIRRGATTPIAALTSVVIPTANPHLEVLDLSAVDIDASGDKLEAYVKVTYNSSSLGVGVILRDGPFDIHLKNSKISA